jgi:8-oxo-dGTP pyrophosphatase MutT (NUDIX family)
MEASNHVHAAGGVIRRHGPDGGLEVALVHRPKYEDWTLPKGKLEAGESHEEAALREVEEETGLSCRLERELDPVSYTDPKGRPKTVRYWVMTVVGGEFRENREVDELRWLSRAAAAAMLTHERDQGTLEALAREEGEDRPA